MKKILPLFIAAFAVLSFNLTLKAAPSIGKQAPEFRLKDAEGNERSLESYRGKYVVLEWVNHGCPFVKKHYNSQNMQKLQADMTERGVVWLSISSSAEGKQGFYTSEQWKALNEEKGSKASAVLLDSSGKVGKMYGAKTTPHMFVIDPKGVLIYKGAIDDQPSTDAETVKGANNYVRTSLEEAMAGKKVSVSETSSYGCSVKYK